MLAISDIRSGAGCSRTAWEKHRLGLGKRLNLWSHVSGLDGYLGTM